MRWTKLVLNRRVGAAASTPAFASLKGGRLHSWKEIAAYLNHGIRTVQRWEESEGLPVHRHAHEKRDSVYAYPDEIDAWWTNHGASVQQGEKARSITPGDMRHARTMHRWLMYGSALVALFCIAAGIGIAWRFSPFRSRALAFKARDWVLIADIDNLTGEPVFDKSLLTAFAVSLEQSPYANVIPRTRVNASLKRMGDSEDTRIDERVGREICLREHIKGLITWSIIKSGGEYALSARLVDPETGATVRSYLKTARNQDRIIEIVGNIAAIIRRDLGESLASIKQNDVALPQVTTPSLEALRSFSEGNDLWRRGQYRQAAKAWETALERDPDFAMAQAAYGSALMTHVFNRFTDGKAHYEKALKLANRITEREQSYIQASYQSSLGHVDEAVRDYQLYLHAYPDDATVRFDLGTLLMNNRRHEEAIYEFNKVLGVDPKNASAWVNLATSYRELDRPEALASYAKAFELEPGWMTLGNLNHEYGFALILNGRIQNAREVFTTALDKPGMKPAALRSLALADMYEGKYRAAEPRLEEAAVLSAENQVWSAAARNHLFLAILMEGRGDRGRELQELDRARQSLALWSGGPLWLPARIGAAYARAGEVGQAESMLRKLAAAADPADVAANADLHILEGEVEMARGNYQRAIGKFQLGAQTTPLPLALSRLARAFRKAGDTEQAAACYEKLLGLRGRTLGWEPQQAWLEAHADLAEIYLARGEMAKAVHALDALAELWKSADRDLPLVKRIAVLRRQANGAND